MKTMELQGTMASIASIYILWVSREGITPEPKLKYTLIPKKDIQVTITRNKSERTIPKQHNIIQLKTQYKTAY